MTAEIDAFSLASLEEASTAGKTAPSVLLVRSVRYYLAEHDSGRPGWPCSSLPRNEDSVEEASAIELEVDGPTWEAFTLEAGRQGVPVDRLLRHAALYYLADRDSGYLAGKILENLEKSE